MADVTQSSSSHGKRAGPLRKTSSRVDMTAMVDVAFLLLTFFVLTATIQSDRLIETVLPPPCDGCTQKVAEEKVLTLILDRDNQLFYYTGEADAAVKQTDYGSNGLRTVLFDHLNRYPNPCISDDHRKNCWDPIFVIKARQQSRYGNFVNLIDELSITQAKKYVIAAFLPEDSLYLKQHLPPEIVSNIY